ncbi:MAG: STAS domain-containing protein [Proteobacteria bacterium]|nr:STAS domain-containing protein [Pseudomonadota bacterium]
MFESRTEDKEKSKVLALSGDLTVSNAELFKTALADAMKNTDNLVLNLTGIIGADVSCLQIICSAHKKAINSNQSIKIDDNPSIIFKDALRDSGFLRQKGCLLDVQERCLLTGKKNE